MPDVVFIQSLSTMPHNLYTPLVSLCLLCVLLGSVGATTHFFDYVVIGAGPAGLEMGYYLQRAGRDYVVLERANVSGMLN